MKAFDEIDLNRMYEALCYRLNALDHIEENEEFNALIELRDRIGEMLDNL